MADLNHARGLLAQGDQEGAVKELVEVLHRNGRNVDAWLLLADLLEDPRERKDCYKQVLKLDPDNQQAYLQLRLLGGTASLKLNRPNGHRPEAAAEAPVEPAPVRPEFKPAPPAANGSGLSPEMLLRSELPEKSELELEPEPPEEPEVDRYQLLRQQATETLKTVPGKATPTLGRTWKLLRTSKLVWIVFIILGIALAGTIFLTVWASTIPWQKPADLIVGPGKKYLPTLADMPQGFTADTQESQLISLPKKAEGYQMVFGNKANEDLQRETGVTYEVIIYTSAVDAEVALMSAANPGSYVVEGNIQKSEVVSPSMLAKVDSSALLFGQGQDPAGRPALSYTLLIRKVNLFARVTVSAAMEDIHSQLAQNMKGSLYQSVFYYATLLTRKLPISANQLVTVGTPSFPTPLPPQPTPTLRVTAPPGEETLFRDRFEDPAASQLNWEIISGAWTFDNGRMSCKAEPVSCEALIGQQNWLNYTFKVDLQGVEGVDKLIYLGVLADKKAYLVKIRSDPADEIVIVEQRAGRADREIKKVTFKNYNRVPYRLELTVKDKTLQVSVDSLKVLEVTDPYVDLTGQVGVGLLAAEEGLPAASIWFDNVSVDPLE
jgi:hypothetical protein